MLRHNLTLRIGAGLSVLGLLAAAVVLRGLWMDHVPGLNGDEAWYGVQAQELLAGRGAALRTPTGNVVNPLFFGPMVLAHLVAPASVVTLRSVALANGLLALVVNWLLCARVFDRRTASMTTAVLAVLPVNIVYSRFAWDASQTLLVTVAVIYCALGAVRFAERRGRWLVAACACAALAVLVHPANVFVAAAIVVAVLEIWPPARWPSMWREASPAARLLVAAITLTFLVGVAVMLWMVDASMVADRLAGVDDLVQRRGLWFFLILFPRLLCGGTSCEFLAGSQAWLQWPAAEAGGGVGCDVLLTWAMLGWALWRLRRSGPADAAVRRSNALPRPSFLRDVPPDDTTVDRAVVLIWALMLVAFLLAAGPSGLAPGYERYGLCLILPSALLVSRALTLPLAGRAWLPLAATLVGWFLLADCFVHYHRFMETTGGQGHFAFRTATVEPKQQAIDVIAEHAAGEPTIVVAGEHWLYWPLRYFSATHANITVVDAQPSAPDVRADLWRVEFTATAAAERTRQGAFGPVEQELIVADAAGRPLISLFRTAR